MKKLPVVPSYTESIYGFIYLALELTILQPLLVLIVYISGLPASDAVLNFLFFSVNFLFVTIILHRYLISSAKHALKNIFATLRSAFVGLVLYWVGSIAVTILVMRISPEFFNVNDSNVSQMTQDSYTLMAIGTVLLVPIAEESLFRGLIFGKLYNRSRVLAYAVSTLAFCAIHVVGYIGLYSPLQLLLSALQYIPAGLCLGWAYASSGTIFSPILIHITINQIAISSMR